ncbi:hypothetical protein FACS1894199_17430 [Bacteroidia bacterium]|nr:hypothetical protein FACS1894199_17430 [Bacteroidia bacterium]
MRLTLHITLRLRQAFCTLLMLCASLSTFGQGNSVTVAVSLTPPYSLVLSDYAKPASQQLVTTIMVNDMRIVNMPVRLHIKMETATGVTIETAPNILVNALYLSGGMTHLLFGRDLAPYFDINNLNFKGYSKEDYRRTGQLPEGFYRFSVELRHFITGRPIGNPGKAMAWIAIGKPPTLKSPEDKAELGQIQGAALTFSWIPTIVGVPNGGAQYKFELWELRIPGINPNVIVQSMPAKYTATQMHSTLIVHPTEMFLEPGMQYAWRVTASDIAGMLPYAQDGHSEVRTFTYQCKCDSVTNFTVKRVGKQATFKWEPAANHTSFNVEMDNPGSDWTRKEQTFNSQATLNFAEGKTYRMRIQSICNGNAENASPFTNWLSVTIPLPPPMSEYCPECACGLEKAPIPITNFKLRDDLKAGDLLIDPRDGGSRYTIKSATLQGNGTYKGLVLFWIGTWNVKVLCEYSDMSVNTDNQILAMHCKSINRPKNLLNVDVDATKEYIDSLTNAVVSLSERDEEPEFTGTVFPENVVTVDFTMPDNPTAILTRAGGLTVTDENGGNSHTVELPKNEDGTPQLPATIQDEGGKKFVVDEKGNITSAGNNDNADNLDEVVVPGLSDNYEVVINGDVSKVTTKPEIKLVPSHQMYEMKVQKNNGDTVDINKIQWKIGKQIVDSTDTQKIVVADKAVSVLISEKVANSKGKTELAKIAAFEFVVKTSISVTFSTLSTYDGEFGFDDGEDFAENSVPKQGKQYETIQITEAKNKVKTLYVPWLTLSQGQPPATLKVNLSKTIDGDNIYVEASSGITANYDQAQKRLTVTNNSLDNTFDNPAYISFYRDDKYELQKKMLIGKLAVVSRKQFSPINVQIIYFASDTTRIKNTVDAAKLQNLLNSKSLNQSFAQFAVLPNIIRIKGNLSGILDTERAYGEIKTICSDDKGMAINYSNHPTTVYVVLTDKEFKLSIRNDGKESYIAGGVSYDKGRRLHNNLAVMWLVENSTENKEKAIIHEIGHTLGLRDVFKDELLGGNPNAPRPTKNSTKSNYMDYYIKRKMFFKTQIQTIIDNLKKGEKP